MNSAKRISTRLVATFSAVAIGFTLAAGPASAAEPPRVPQPVVSDSRLVADLGGGGVETQGIKSWLVKQALKAVAGTIRGGASTFIRLGDDFLDAGAKSALRNHSGRIADVIEDVAEIPDIATHMVRSEVYRGLKGFLGHGTANVIANAVEGVLWVFL